MASSLEAGGHSRYRMHDILETKPYAASEAERPVDRRGRSTGARVRGSDVHASDFMQMGKLSTGQVVVEQSDCVDM